MAETDVQHDVIVIGAGIAGLVAANRSAQLGKRVIVLEKSKEEKYLCNSRYTYGTFHINFTDVAADEDVLFDKIEACTEGLARKDLAHAIAKDGRRLMQWLKSEGIDLVDLGGYQTNVLAPPWRKGFGLTWRGYAGDVALARLKPDDARLAERFELYAGGLELANGFSELCDSKEQRARLEVEQRARKALGRDVFPLDEEFLQSLDRIGEAGGVAVGVDRLLMLLTGAQAIADVLLFPAADEYPRART